MRLSTLLACVALLTGAGLAAPTNETRDMARDCSTEIAEYNLSRREKRDQMKRSFYQTMPNQVCLLSPEVSRKNWTAIDSSLIRQDVTEGQSGISLLLDIGILDVTTCRPVSGAMVEVWSANQVGEYGETFLRGAYKSEANGIVEFNTIFPGYTSDGANHINIAVHSGGSMNDQIVHTGQVFFTDPWTNIISRSTGYNQNKHTRVMNAQDSNFVAANRNGYNAIVDILSIQDDWPTGVIGYITVGINPNISI
ncbi:aromatic compound dioxygenase [Dendrothele bispora CBS 962.96]|uniref:Aromatic compound dioxygenase n=1 Tax=Dendrothele bispora (strain CBS 962.96) TaxID=1314807 RepID=A0A4S8LSF3_DENBC|nr:aromatic compound dioxygenase [Dendrothele bispora CBS 962.96]